MSPGTVADYTETLNDAAGSGNIFALLTGNAQFTINGGSLGGTGLGGGSGFGLTPEYAAFQLQGNSRLAINNATVKVNSNGIVLNGAATQAQHDQLELDVGWSASAEASTPPAARRWSRWSDRP